MSVDRAGAKRSVARREFVQVFAGDQAVHGRTEIGEANRAAPTDFAFVGYVVLVDARLVNIERHNVDGGSVSRCPGLAAGQGAEAVRAFARPTFERTVGRIRVSCCYAWLKGLVAMGSRMPCAADVG